MINLISFLRILCKSQNILLVEDAAQAHGAKYKNIKQRDWYITQTLILNIDVLINNNKICDIINKNVI